MPSENLIAEQKAELAKKIDEAYRHFLAFRGVVDPEMKKWLTEVLEILYWHGYGDGVYSVASDIGADINRSLRRFGSDSVCLGWVSDTHLGKRKAMLLAEDYKKECDDL